MKFGEIFFWELTKIKGKYSLVKFFLIGILILLVFLFLFSINFGKNYFDWINVANVKNITDYFFTRLCVIISLLFSLFIILATNLIYEGEFTNKIYLRLTSTNIGIRKILNNKLYLHVILTLSFIIVIMIFIQLFVTIMKWKYEDYAHYSTRSNWISYLEYGSLLFSKAINCCILIRIVINLIKNESLRYTIYGVLIFNNLIFRSTPFNFFHTSQSNFTSSLFISLFITSILSCLLTYEKRIFKS